MHHEGLLISREHPSLALLARCQHRDNCRNVRDTGALPRVQRCPRKHRTFQTCGSICDYRGRGGSSCPDLQTAIQNRPRCVPSWARKLGWRLGSNESVSTRPST
jgi:hypothetical protein